MVIAEGTTAFAAYPAGVVEEKEPEILGTSGKGYAAIYEIEGDLVYGADYSDHYALLDSWVVKDYDKRVVKDYSLTVSDNLYPFRFNGEGYRDMSDLYYAGVKPGDRIDVDVILTIREAASPISPTQTGYYDKVYTCTVKGVEIIKGQITKDDLVSGFVYYKRGNTLRDIENKKVPWALEGYRYCSPYLILTDEGAEKLKDPGDRDVRDLNAYEDFDLKIERYSGPKRYSSLDITDYFDIDLEGAKVTFSFQDGSEIKIDVDEVRVGTSAAEFRKILRDNASLKFNCEVQDAWSGSDMKIDKISWRSGSGNFIDIDPDDDRALEQILSGEGNEIKVKGTTQTNGYRYVYAYGDQMIVVRKNSYRLILEPFKEVASATGASYDRTKHDFMSNVYALKNETEKIRVGSLGDGERFRLNVFDKDYRHLKGEEKGQFFERIRPGDRLNYNFRWYIPSEGRYLKYQSAEWDENYFSTGYIMISERPLEFFEYGSGDGSGDEQSDTFPATVSSPYVDPFAPAHKTEAYDIGELPADAAPYEFDVMRSTTAIGAVPVKISKKFSSYVSMDGFDPFVNHRFTTDNRSIATVDKKGYLKPKKRGRINIFLEQKSDDGGWIRLGEPVEMFVQVPQMKKKEYVSAGTELNGHSFISMTTFAPNKWISSKPSVAMVDEKTGKITVVGTGTTKIIAVYGNPENRKYNSKKKYKTTLKVE